MNTISTDIAALQKEGKTPEEIYLQLLNRGETVQNIQKGFGQTAGNELPEESSKEETNKRAIQIVVYFGALLIGAGIFSFIASNWKEVGSVAKVLMILFFMIAAYTGGWFAKEKRGLRKTGEALYLLGNIIYGAGIFLVAQIFHIRADWPDGFILWLLGALFAGYALESTPVYVVAFIVGLIATIASPFGLLEESYNPYLMTSSLLLLVAVIATFAIGFLLHKQIPAEYFEEGEQ